MMEWDLLKYQEVVHWLAAEVGYTGAETFWNLADMELSKEGFLLGYWNLDLYRQGGH